jgi:hypothetical protein
MLSACHTHGLPPVPGQGGPAWRELESEHFTMWTDTSPGRARELIREMEHQRQVVLGVGFASSHAEGRSFVIALRDPYEVGEFLPEQFAAYAYSGGPLFQPTILLPAEGDRRQAHLVTHELTHVISYNVIRHQPHWFAEGLAEFFATVNLDADAATGNIGRPADEVLAQLRHHFPTPTATMLACRGGACMDSAFYATAWVMFSYLANERPADLLRYATRLDELSETEADKAWAEVFPDLTPHELDGRMRLWLEHGRHREFTFDVKLQEWPISERPLNDGDVYAARAALRFIGAAPGAAAPPELAAALAADPTNLLAHLIEYGITQKIDPATADAVAAAHPGDWRSWLLVGESRHWKGDDAHTAHNRACTILAVKPAANLPMGWCSNE